VIRHIQLRFFFQQNNSDAKILLNKNQIKAVCRMIFVILRKTLGLCETPKPLKGRQVALQNVLVWMIREQRLHGLDQKDVEINIKLDGRPFWGKQSALISNN